MVEAMSTPRPLTLNDGWDQQVNGKAKRTDEQMECEKRYRAEKEARRQAEKRAVRTLRMITLGFALIFAGGVYMNFVEGSPMWLSITATVAGAGLCCFALGILLGRSQRC